MPATEKQTLEEVLRQTSAISYPKPGMAGGSTLGRKLRAALTSVWSTTEFDDADVTDYAERVMLIETRRGLTLMASLSLLIQLAAVVLYQKLNIHGSFFYTYALLAMLSIHVVISARFVSDMRALTMLGTILLVITSVAIMAIAHRAGDLNVGLLVSIVMLFMVMPLAPWGLRDAGFVVAVIYAIFTLSASSVQGRFDSDSLWTLQFLIIAAAVTSILVIVRSTLIRKDDIRARHGLEVAHRELQLISTRDPLTGAWNRRYLRQNFGKIAKDVRRLEKPLHLAVLDVDDFKSLNDSHGHHFGDEVLQRLVNVMNENLPGTAHVLRLGGDEFAVLDTSENFEGTVRRCLQHLETDPHLLDISQLPVRVSVGFATVPPGERAELDLLYRTADEALYENKDFRRRKALTGRWRISPMPD